MARDLGGTCTPPSAQTTVPTYLDALALNENELHAYLIQSCALPELFPARTVGDHSYIHGRVADNLPILPLLDCGEVLSRVVDRDHDQAASFRAFFSS